MNDKHAPEELCDCGIVAELIEKCELFIYVGCEHAYNSDYAFRKVHHAVDVIENVDKLKRNKSVLTLLDGEPQKTLPPSLMFLLSNVNHRQKSQGVFPTLLKDITRQLGLEAKANAGVKYDVFISYSHKDAESADRLALYLDEYTVNAFMYESDISGGENYLDEISRAIDSCSAFIFIGSPDSYHSKYTIKELHYAINTKGEDRVIIYEPNKAIMPQDIALLTTGAALAKSLPDIFKQLKRLMTTGPRVCYNPGDIYRFGNAEGLVFLGDTLGRAVCVDEHELQWCVESKLYDSQNLELDEEDLDGYIHRRPFKKYPVYARTFPAAGACAMMASHWFLPGILELEAYAEYWDMINDVLMRNGHSPLEVNEFYWSATEMADASAFAWGCVFKKTSSGRIVAERECRKKTEKGHVRMMLFFGLMS